MPWCYSIPYLVQCVDVFSALSSDFEPGIYPINVGVLATFLTASSRGFPRTLRYIQRKYSVFCADSYLIYNFLIIKKKMASRCHAEFGSQAIK